MTPPSDPSSPRLPPRPSYPRTRKRQQQHKLIRLKAYETYVNGVLLGSDLATATKFFEQLSPSQRHRVLNDPRFVMITTGL